MIFPWAFGLYLAGLGMAGSYPVSYINMAVLIIVGVIVAIILRKERAAAVILTLCFLPLGALLGGSAYERLQRDEAPSIYRIYDKDTPLRIYGEIQRTGLTLFGKKAILVRTHTVESRYVFKKVDATLLVFIPGDDINLSPGNGVSFNCVLGDQERYLKAMVVKKLAPDAWCVAQRGTVEPFTIPNPVVRGLIKFKYILLWHLTPGLRDDEFELYQGVVFGKQATHMTKQTRDSFQEAGISHLIVASGAQVALIIFPFFTLYRRIRHRWTRALLFLLMAGAMLLLLYVVGPSSSILRAVSVGFIVLIGHAMGRPTNALNSLAFAGLLWLVIDPLLIHDYSFLLSYAASFGILYMGPVLVSAVESRFPKGLRGADPLRQGFWNAYFWVKRNTIHLGIITISSQWGVLPILASMFGKISLNGLIANLFAVPAGSIVLMLGALSGALGFIHPSLSLVLNLMAKPLLLFMMGVANIFASLGALTFQGQRIPIAAVIAYYFVSIMVIESLRGGLEIVSYALKLRRMVLGNNND